MDKFIAMLVLAALCFLLAFGLPTCLASWRCSSVAEETGVPTRFTIGTGCLVQIDGKWIPYDRWRAVEK